MGTAYFLGAGASVAAGVPATHQLLDKVEEHLPKRGQRPLKRFLEEFGGRVTQGDALPIIRVVNFLNSAIGEDKPLTSGFTTRQLTEIRRNLIIRLSKAIHAEEKGDRVRLPKEAQYRGGPKSIKVPQYFRRFVRALVPPGGHRSLLSRGDVVITTNYDTVIDRALFELAYRPGIEAPTDVYLGSRFRDPITDEEAYSDPRSPVGLLKLHGSLNWLFCPRCSRIFVSAFEDSVVSLARPDPWDHICYCDYSPLEPVLVAPSGVQDLTNPHLASIWIDAHLALEKRGRWIIAGYDLPGEDLAVRALLYRAWSARRDTGKSTKIVVVNLRKHRKQRRQRFANLFDEGVEYVEKQFEEYACALALA